MTKTKSRSDDFHESLSSTMPSVQTYQPESREVPASLARYGLIVLWVLVVILAGVGIGLAMIAARQSNDAAVPPKPVATQPLAVHSVTSSRLVRPGTPSTAALTVRPATSVYQGTPLDVAQVAQTTSYQPAAQPSMLLPGFINYGFGQGGNGTDPVTR